MEISKVIVEKLPKNCLECDLKSYTKSGWAYCFITGKDLKNLALRPAHCPLITIERMEEIILERGAAGLVLYMFGALAEREI